MHTPRRIGQHNRTQHHTHNNTTQTITSTTSPTNVSPHHHNTPSQLPSEMTLNLAAQLHNSHTPTSLLTPPILPTMPTTTTPTNNTPPPNTNNPTPIQNHIDSGYTVLPLPNLLPTDIRVLSHNINSLPTASEAELGASFDLYHQLNPSVIGLQETNKNWTFYDATVGRIRQCLERR